MKNILQGRILSSDGYVVSSYLLTISKFQLQAICQQIKLLNLKRQLSLTSLVNLANWNPTENCFLPPYTLYHPMSSTFMVHQWGASSLWPKTCTFAAASSRNFTCAADRALMILAPRAAQLYGEVCRNMSYFQLGQYMHYYCCCRQCVAASQCLCIRYAFTALVHQLGSQQCVFFWQFCVMAKVLMIHRKIQPDLVIS